MPHYFSLYLQGSESNTMKSPTADRNGEFVLEVSCNHINDIKIKKWKLMIWTYKSRFNSVLSILTMWELITLYYESSCMIMLHYSSLLSCTSCSYFVSHRPLEVILLQWEKSLFSPFTGSVISPDQNQSKAVRVSIQLINE